MPLSEFRAAKGISAFSFREYRQLEKLLRRDGWAVSLYQLRPSGLTTTVYSLEKAELVTATASDRLEVAGRTSKDVVTVVQPARSTRLWLNGYKLFAGDVLALPADYPFTAWSSDNCCVLLLLVSLDGYGRTNYLDSSAGRLLLAGESVYAEQAVRGFCQYCENAGPLAICRAGPSLSGVSVESGAVHGHLNWKRLEGSDKTPEPTYRVLRDSIRYIDRNLTWPISVADISEAAATNVRQLERIFRSEIGLTPSRYVRARRLTVARNRLQNLASTSAETTVASVALDSGFDHLGRFAGEYRACFGELPSETLKATKRNEESLSKSG